MTPLRAMRLDAGMSREELAQKLGVSFWTIGNYEKSMSGMLAMSVERLLMVCEIFDTTPNDFLQGVKM